MRKRKTNNFYAKIRYGKHRLLDLKRIESRRRFYKII